jgi:hypothetical protein
MNTVKLIFAIAVSVGILILIHSWRAAQDDQEKLRIDLAAQKKVIASAESQEREQGESLRKSLAQIAALKRKTRTPKAIADGINRAISLPEPIVLSGRSANASVNRSEVKTGSDSPVSSATQAAEVSGEPSHAESRGTGARKLGEAIEGSAKDVARRLTRDTAAAHETPCAPLSIAHAADASPCTEALKQRDAAANNSVASISAEDLRPIYDSLLDSKACAEKLAAASSDELIEQKKISALMVERNSAIAAAKGGGKWSRLRRAGLWIGVGVLGGVVLTTGLRH